MTRWNRAILHVDMDAFYAAVEQRDDPALRGRPVIVGGLSPRGVVATASYEARAFGVRSAIPTARARKLCPDGIFVAPKMEAYAAASRTLMEILGRYSPDVEPLSLDEAFVDLTGTERLFGPPDELAVRIRREIRDALHLTASAGLATSKYVAKVASDVRKPDGLTVVAPGTERAFLAPLSIDRLWGVGAKTAPRVRALGLETIGDVAARTAAGLHAALGHLGDHIHALANGEDPRSVHADRARLSLGSERTLDRDIVGRDAVRDALLPCIDEVSRGLRAKHLRCLGVRLKLTLATFQGLTRELQLDRPASDASSIRAALDVLLDRAPTELPIRLIGVTATGLIADERADQLSLFGDEAVDQRERLEAALDRATDRFGKGAVVRASALNRSGGD
ncbi:MAG: DNA polymerase IV [Myxococcales bacterium]|nr:DNA polymerase IV [Myxococcales bacterium]MCB9530974.1 DNA polymerase IV [Myxococcales bacterium]MCB9532894.1 DNA polymerase IV [Myxococcales bacterium]